MSAHGRTGCSLGLCALMATPLQAATPGEIGGTSTSSINISVRIPTTVRARVLPNPPKVTANVRPGQLCVQSDRTHRFHVYVLTSKERAVSSSSASKKDSLMTSIIASEANHACGPTYTVKPKSPTKTVDLPVTVLIAPE